MTHEGDSPDQFPYAGGDDPRTIAAIGAELERIIGASTTSEQDPFGGINWALPMRSFEQLLEFLREMPSDIGLSEFSARVLGRSKGPVPKGVLPEKNPDDGA